MELSRIGLGTVQFGTDYGFTKAFDQGLVDDILYRCRSLGVKLLDTAPGYGDSESKIGHYFRTHPYHGFIACTKLAVLGPEEAASSVRLRLRIAESILASREALFIDTIPMLMLHQTDRFILENESFWEILGSAREDGVFESFGVSVYEVEEVEMLLGAKRTVDFFQVPYNVFDRRFHAVSDRVRSAGGRMIGRSAFLKGMLTADAAGIPEALAGLRVPLEKFQAVAAKAGISPAELALSFVLGSGCVESTVLGVASAEEMEKNVKALSRLEETAPLLRELDALDPVDRAMSDPRRWPQTVFAK